MPTPVATHRASRRGPWRWAIALVATIALIVSGSGLVVFAQSGAGESRGPVFVPSDASLYLEARLDMPAGQDEALAQMLTAFPGFADTSSFDMKLDELLSGLVSEMGIDVPMEQVFGEALTGEIGLAVVDFAEAAVSGDDPAILLGLAVADAAMAQSMLESLTADAATSGAASEEVYGDATIISDPSTSATVYADWVLLSNDAEQVKGAVDVLDGSAGSLAAAPAFAESFARVPVGHLAAAYVDLAAFGPLLDLAGTAAAGETGMELPVGDLGAMLAPNMVAYLAAQPDRLDLEAVLPPGEHLAAMAIGESDLATVFPAETQVYIEGRAVGTLVENVLTGVADLLAEQQAMTSPDDPDAGMGGLSDIEALFGESSPFTSMLGAPLPQVLDFVGDIGIGAGLDSDGLWLGIAGDVTDEVIAAERVGNIVSLMRLLAGNPEESGINVTTEMLGAVEVTTITLPLDDMAAESGLPVGLGDSISVAVADGRLLLGMGDFVQAAISADGSDSLATSERYVDALAGDTVNAGVWYVDATGLLAGLDPMLSSMGPEWSDIAPFASAVDSIVAVVTQEDDGAALWRMSVIVDS